MNDCRMASVGRSNKICKEGGAKPDAFEELVAGAIFDLQVQTDMKADLQDLFITSASEMLNFRRSSSGT